MLGWKNHFAYPKLCYTLLSVSANTANSVSLVRVLKIEFNKNKTINVNANLQAKFDLNLHKLY